MAKGADVMRINARTPPIRLEASFMADLMHLPAEHVGILVQAGMILYAEGRSPTVDEMRSRCAVDERSWTIFIQTSRRHIDQQDLAAGIITIEEFRRAGEHRDNVSAARVRTIQKETVLQAAVGEGAVRSTNTERKRPEDDMDPAHLGFLVAAGAKPEEARSALARWYRDYGAAEVSMALPLIEGRRIARPVKYLETVLQNNRQEAVKSMPASIRLASGGKSPRAIRRRIQMASGAPWTQEGWTAKGHARDGGTREGRMAVWRTDSGALSYKHPDDLSAVPDYDEDAGVYEAD